MKPGNDCYQSVQNLLSYSLISKNIKIKIHRTIIVLVTHLHLLQRLRMSEAEHLLRLLVFRG
jgi:hypothetical protein